MSDFGPLLQHIAGEQDRLRARAQHRARGLSRFLANTEHPTRSRPLILYWGLAAAVLTLAVCSWHFTRPSPLTVQVAGTDQAAPTGVWLGADQSKGFGLEFSEGTKVAFGVGSSARMLSLTARGAELELKQGRARLEVVPLPEARWSLKAGPFTIVVTGTKFDVMWDAETDSLKVVMHEGQVKLVGCGFGEGRALTAGQTARARCRDSVIKVGYGHDVEFDSPVDAQAGADSETVEPVDSSHAAGVQRRNSLASSASQADAAERLKQRASQALREVDASARAVTSPSQSASAPPVAPAVRDWKALARSGAYAKLRQVVEEAGFESTVAGLGASDLMLLGEALRHAGGLDKSAQSFLTVRQRFAGSSEASMAAFALGRLHFDARGAHATAARWFRVYLKESPGGAFAREALGRLMEASDKAGNLAESQELARRYSRLYPAGPHAELAARITDKP